jgi:hypothetical protein
MNDRAGRHPVKRSPGKSRGKEIGNMEKKAENSDQGNCLVEEERAAYLALKQLQDKLATLPGWRAGLAWEAAFDAEDVLRRGLSDARVM